MMCPRCRATHPSSADCPEYPRIVWTPVQNRAALERCISSGYTVRVRVLRGKHAIEADCDFWRMPFELSQDAARAIFEFAEGRVVSIGGGRSCLKFKCKPISWQEMCQFVSKILSDKKSWIRISAHKRFPRDSFQVFGEENEEWDYGQQLTQGDQEYEQQQ